MIHAVTQDDGDCLDVCALCYGYSKCMVVHIYIYIVNYTPKVVISSRGNAQLSISHLNKYTAVCLSVPNCKIIHIQQYSTELESKKNAMQQQGTAQVNSILQRILARN